MKHIHDTNFILYPSRFKVFCGFQIHDSFANASRMRSVLHYKCEFVIILYIIGIILLLVLCYIAKLCNTTRFAAIETRPYTLSRRWMLRFTSWCYTIEMSPPWGSFSLRFDILYIKHRATCFIDNSFIGTVSKVVIKYSYKGDVFSSKVIMMASSRTSTFQHSN